MTTISNNVCAAGNVDRSFVDVAMAPRNMTDSLGTKALVEYS